MGEDDTDDDSDNGGTALTLGRRTAVPRPKRVVAATACLRSNMNACGKNLLGPSDAAYGDWHAGNTIVLRQRAGGTCFVTLMAGAVTGQGGMPQQKCETCAR